MNKKVESEWYLEEDLSPMNGKVWRMCKNLGADRTCIWTWEWGKGVG